MMIANEARVAAVPAAGVGPSVQVLRFDPGTVRLDLHQAYRPVSLAVLAGPAEPPKRRTRWPKR